MISKCLSLVLWVFVSVNIDCKCFSINNYLRPNNVIPTDRLLDPAIMKSIANGAKMAMDTCKTVFKWDKWNCPQASFSKQQSQVFTREKAYVDAILSAGIIYSITKDCSQGMIRGCGCNPHLQNSRVEHVTANRQTVARDWVWGGCSDDVTFGENLVLRLLEESERSIDPQTYISRHNRRSGREIIRAKMSKTCKCHGVSGSCTFQTCWMQMSGFDEIARQLRQHYNNAIMISFEKIRGGLSLGNSARQFRLQDVLPHHLLYFQNSPDFCKSNNATGWPGTKGRTCSRNRSATTSIGEKKSCRNLCRSCGYKVRKQQRKVSVRCECKFTWCCEVECNVCTQNVEEYFCH